MYSYKERKTAVELYINYGRRAARVIKELGYPNRRQLTDCIFQQMIPVYILFLSAL